MNNTQTELYTVIAYDPLHNVCDLCPASQNQRGVLRSVQIACWWGGDYQQQAGHTPAFKTDYLVSSWGSSPGGARWGVSYPVQLGDKVEVEFMGADQSSPVIRGFVGQWRGQYTPAYVGQQVHGESPKNRFDLLLPSGAWLRGLADGTWIIATPTADAPTAKITMKPDGSVTIDCTQLTFNASAVAVNATGGTHFANGSDSTINGKGISVLTGVDSAGDSNVSTGQ